MRKLAVCCLSFVLLMFSNVAQAGNWSFKVEPGLALALGSPQSELFNLGGDAMVKALFGIGDYVDVGPTVGFVGLPASKDNTFSGDTGTGWQFGGGFRFKRPHNRRAKSAVNAVSPWADFDLMYVHTGPLDRLGLAIGTGFAFPLDQDRHLWLGPFVRYTQILQSEKNKKFDNRDAKILIVGLSFEFGSSNVPKKHQAVPVCPECLELPEVLPCPPPPKVEPCPPIVRVIPSMEVVQFDWDSDVLTEEGTEVLQKAHQTLKDNENYDLSIEGHASSEGQFEHNINLSERRAKTVLEYLVARGISRDRLVSKWFGSGMPTENNDTLRGRVANRRVMLKLEVSTKRGAK